MLEFLEEAALGLTKIKREFRKIRMVEAEAKATFKVTEIKVMTGVRVRVKEKISHFLQSHASNIYIHIDTPH